jgi:hypothetical protein
VIKLELEHWGVVLKESNEEYLKAQFSPSLIDKLYSPPPKIDHYSRV